MSGAGLGTAGVVWMAVGGTVPSFGGCASGLGSLPGKGGCEATPRFGIGSATIGGITRVGRGAGRTASPAAEGAGDAFAERSADGEGCT